MPRRSPPASALQRSGRRSSSATPPASSASANGADRDERGGDERRRPRQARRAAQRSDDERGDADRLPRPPPLGGLDQRHPVERPRTAAKTRRTSPAPRRERQRGTPGRDRRAAPGPARRAARRRCSGGASYRSDDRRAAGPAGHEAVAAGHLEHGPAPAISPGQHHQAAARRAPEPARRAVDDARGDEDDEPAPVLRGGQRGPDVRPPSARAARAPAARPAGRGRSSPRGGRRAAAARSRCAWRSARSARPPRAPRRRARRATRGARGSSTTSGRESASEISLRSIIPAPRASARPVDARRGRALAVLAQPVDLRLRRRDQRGARVGADAVAAAGRGAHREHARQHEHLVDAARPRTTRWASPNGSRSTSAGGASTRRPRRANVTSDAHPRARAARGDARPARAAAARRSSRAAAAAARARPRSRTGSGSSSATLRAPISRVHRRAPRAERRSTPPRRAEQDERRAGDVQRLGVERPGDEQQQRPRAPRSRGRSARRPPLERRGGGDGVGDDLLALDARGLGDEHEPVREHGGASAWTSSGSAWSRPLRSACALAARSSISPARGEAPSSTRGSSRVWRSSATM